MTLAQAIDEIVESPEFFDMLEGFERRRRDEQQARQRFEASLDEDVRAEFIAGKVVVQMSSRTEHIEVRAWIADLLKLFIETRGSGRVFTENALIRTKRNDYVADLCYWSANVAKSFTRKQAIFPPPRWVVEVLSPDTEARDRGVKFRDYAAAGVLEYWIVDADAESIEQYPNVADRFKLVKTHRTGIIRGIAIAKFAIPVRAAFDAVANLEQKQVWWTRA